MRSGARTPSHVFVTVKACGQRGTCNTMPTTDKTLVFPREVFLRGFHKTSIRHLYECPHHNLCVCSLRQTALALNLATSPAIRPAANFMIGKGSLLQLFKVNYVYGNAKKY